MTTADSTMTSMASPDLRTVQSTLSSPDQNCRSTSIGDKCKTALQSAGFTSVTRVYGVYAPLNVITAWSLGHALLLETASTRLQPSRPFLIC